MDEDTRAINVRLAFLELAVLGLAVATDRTADILKGMESLRDEVRSAGIPDEPACNLLKMLEDEVARAAAARFGMPPPP